MASIQTKVQILTVWTSQDDSNIYSLHYEWKKRVQTLTVQASQVNQFKYTSIITSKEGTHLDSINLVHGLIQIYPLQCGQYETERRSIFYSISLTSNPVQTSVGRSKRGFKNVWETDADNHSPEGSLITYAGHYSQRKLLKTNDNWIKKRDKREKKLTVQILQTVFTCNLRAGGQTVAATIVGVAQTHIGTGLPIALVTLVRSNTTNTNVHTKFTQDVKVYRYIYRERERVSYLCAPTFPPRHTHICIHAHTHTHTHTQPPHTTQMPTLPLSEGMSNISIYQPPNRCLKSCSRPSIHQPTSQKCHSRISFQLQASKQASPISQYLQDKLHIFEIPWCWCSPRAVQGNTRHCLFHTRWYPDRRIHCLCSL